MTLPEIGCLSSPMTWLRGKITCLALMLTVLTLKLGKHYFPILFRFFSFFFLFLFWTLQLYIILIYEKDLPLVNKVYVCNTIFIKFKHKLVFNVLNFLLLWANVPTHPHIHIWDSTNLQKSCFHVNLKIYKSLLFVSMVNVYIQANRYRDVK